MTAGSGKGGFLGSDPKMYGKMQIEGDLKKLKERDVMNTLSRATGAGFTWNPETVRLSRPGFGSVVTQSPWVHADYMTKNTCGFDSGISFHMFGVIAPRCLRCWKTCVGLKDYDTTVKVVEYQKTYPGACKVGMELRDYTPRLWGAYFYRDSFDQGRDTFKKVKAELNDVIGPDNFNIILKRGCTEFELLTGPSLFWDYTEEQRDLYELISLHFENNDKHHSQPQMLKDHVMMKWPLWAHSHGDMSYVSYNGGKELWGKLVPYHEGDREQVKKEMAVAFQMSKQVRTTDKEGIKQNIVKDTPIELTGDSDELT